MDAIKKYSVQIDYILQGSGVLVKVDNENCYLITAKHNFKNNNDDSYADVDTASLKFNDIKISNPNNENICSIEKLVYEEKKLDLLVFMIKSNANYIKNLPILEIVKDKHIISKKHFFYGFPNGKETPSGELTPLAFRVKNDEKHILTLRGDNKNIYVDDEKGFSGSGVFIKEGNQTDGYRYYLTGVVTAVHEGQSYYETISLSEIIDKVNLNLNPKIEVKEDIVDIDFSKNIYTRILKRNQNSYLVEKIKESFLENEQKLDNLNRDEFKRKELIDFLDNDKERLIQWEKELADLYLLKAIIYNSNENRKDADFYLGRARKFNSQFKKYQLYSIGNIENVESDTTITEEFLTLQKAKIYYIDKDYHKAIEYLNKAIEESTIEYEKIDIYQYLAKSNTHIKQFEDAKDTYMEILSLYSSLSNIQIEEKAETYYELSLICQRKEALGYVDTGLKVLEEDKDKNFLEIKYELEKRRNSLSEINNTKILNPTLLELFKKNPEKYMDDFLKSLKNSNEEISNNDIYQKIIELHQEVRGIVIKKN
jgi:tetratricopeptide (TPR) repeat protein